MSGKLLILKPSGDRQEIDWPAPGMVPLEVLQKAVGGYIERVKVKLNDRHHNAFVNEEGRIDELTPNVFASALLAPPFNPSANAHQLLGNLAIWMPDMRSVDPAARATLHALFTGITEAGYSAVYVAASAFEQVPEFKTRPALDEATVIEQAILADSCIIYFRHPSSDSPTAVQLETENGPEMIIDCWSSDEGFYQTMEQIRASLDEHEED